MGKKPSIFQPDHLGRRTPDKPGPWMNHSHNDAAVRGHLDRIDAPNIARTTAVGKHTYPTKIHGAMVRQTEGGPAFGGDHASAMDSLSGRRVVLDKSGAVATAHPLTKIPPGKPSVGRAVGVNPGTRSRADDDLGGGGSPVKDAAGRQGHARARHAEAVEIGRKVLAEAIRT